MIMRADMVVRHFQRNQSEILITSPNFPNLILKNSNKLLRKICLALGQGNIFRNKFIRVF